MQLVEHAMELVKNRKLGFNEDWENKWANWEPSSPIRLERQQELARLRSQNVEKGLPPMAGVKLLRGDIEWLIVENGGPIHYGDDRDGRVGIDLRQSDLTQTDCSSLPLNTCFFQDARTDFAIFSDCDLRWSLFDRAHMSEADFARADLFKAQFNGTYLRDIDMRGANLESAWFDDSTYLDGAKLNGAFLSGCHWRGVDLTHIEWKDVRKIGEEIHAGQIRLKLRAEGYNDATDAYARISQLIRDQGRLSDSARYYFRSNVMRRKYLWYSLWQDALNIRPIRAGRRLLSLISCLILEAICGYGEYPSRVVFWAAVVVSIFAALFRTVANSPNTHFDIPAAIVFSASSFLGRGYALVLPVTSLAEPASILSVIEAGLGTTLEILFVTTFTRRLVRG